MATLAIKATGSQITFCDTNVITRQEATMGIILQKYTRLFREVWPEDYPPLDHTEYCILSNLLTLYTDDKEIDHTVVVESTVSHLESECKEILCRILQGTFL